LYFQVIQTLILLASLAAAGILPVAAKEAKYFEMKTEKGLSLHEIAESLSIWKTVVKKHL
jgi:predicted DNA-binding protein YlxM (UPF0122 family)